MEYLIAKASEILFPRLALKNSDPFTADDSLFGSDKMTRQPSMFDNPNIASFVSLENIANVDDIQQKVQRIASAQNLQ